MHEKHIDQLPSPIQVITMLNRTEKHENKEEGKPQHETHRGKNHKATQTKKKQDHRLRTDSSINYQEFKARLLYTNLHPDVILNI